MRCSLHYGLLTSPSTPVQLRSQITSLVERETLMLAAEAETAQAVAAGEQAARPGEAGPRRRRKGGATAPEERKGKAPDAPRFGALKKPAGKYLPTGSVLPPVTLRAVRRASLP